jgi:hypothetical protein
MYLDPGSGSFIIQMLIASLVAVPFFLRHQIARAYRSVRNIGRHPETPPPSDDAGTES